MARVILFHSIYGLRPAEHALAAAMRAVGHAVDVPDLYRGETAETVEAGAEIRDRIGWPAIVAAARAAAAPLPADAVLAGVSMGAGVAGEIWQARPDTAGVLLFHGPCAIPATPRPGVPLQTHLAEPEPFDDEEFLSGWAAGAKRVGVVIEVFRYSGAGHYFCDASLPDHDATVAELALHRALEFLSRVDTRRPHASSP